jgi:hypothetical protein
MEGSVELNIEILVIKMMLLAVYVLKLLQSTVREWVIFKLQ